MPLDGLRAWIGEVERKLGMRTRVFLVLATIAIGGAGAAIYLAVDTRENAVSESDVRELQERLEGRSGGATAADPRVGQLEGELKALESEVERLGGGKASGQDAEGGTSDAPIGEGDAAGASLGGEIDKDKVRELLEQAKGQSEAAE
jgi:hypothetical protein